MEDKEIKVEMVKRLRGILKIPMMDAKKLLVNNDFDFYKVFMEVGSTERLFFRLDYKDSEEVLELKKSYKRGDIYYYIEELLSKN